MYSISVILTIICRCFFAASPDSSPVWSPMVPPISGLDFLLPGPRRRAFWDLGGSPLSSSSLASPILNRGSFGFLWDARDTSETMAQIEYSTEQKYLKCNKRFRNDVNIISCVLPRNVNKPQRNVNQLYGKHILL